MNCRGSLPIIHIRESRFLGGGQWRVLMPLALAHLTAGGYAWIRLEDQGGLEVRAWGLWGTQQITETDWYCSCYVDQTRPSQQSDAPEAGWALP